jgi:glycosyltransferase involved in cell wall biosynthesis
MTRLSNIKVLMTTDTVGGVWTYATGLASALAASGADVQLVTIGPRARPDQREMLPASVQVIESDLALEWQDPEGADLAHAREFLGTVERQIRPDIIHLNSYREATFGWHAPVIVVAHSCVNSWGMACKDTAFLSAPRWQRYRRLVTEGLDRADIWVSPTSAFGDVIRELYQPRSPQIVIRNGAIPAGIATENDKRLILAAGRMWDASKNLSLLAEAAADLDWPVFVAGTAAESGGKLSSGIELLGELSHCELIVRMQCAAIFVSPARYEPFGLSVLEAAGAGCALILSDIPSFRELWDGAALFVAAGDVHGLRAALTDLSLDEHNRTWLQRAALARAKRYSMAQMTAAYARLYRSLLPRSSRVASKAVEVWA